MGSEGERSGPPVARGFRVEGRVQGVGYRWWVQRTGESLGLGGHVRNLPDGGVEVHVRGPGEAVDALAQALQEGPSMARVRAVHAIDPDPRTPSDRFLIERW